MLHTNLAVEVMPSSEDSEVKRQQMAATQQIRPMNQQLSATGLADASKSISSGTTGPVPSKRLLPKPVLREIIGFMRGRYGNSA